MKNQINDIATKVVDLLMDVVCVVDLEGNFVYINASCEKVFGYTPEEMLGTNMISYVHPDDREKTLATATQIMRGHEEPYFENRYLRKDGSTVYIMWSARWSENDKVRVAVARDITVYKRYQRIQNSIFKISEMAHQANDLSELYQQAHESISRFIAAESFIVAIKEEGKDTVNLSYCVDGQYQPKKNIKLTNSCALGKVIDGGKTLLINSNRESALLAKINHNSESDDKGNWVGVPLKSKETVFGALVIHATESSVYTKQDVKLMEFVGEQFAATIERKEYERKLHHIASHDWLTGLPNRLLFNDRLDVAIKRATRNKEKLALLYMDLDGFKEVNDSLGHTKGDLLLSKVANRIRSCVRDSDTVARMGGDEFTVLLTEINQGEAIDAVLGKINEVVEKPFMLEGSRVHIGISIGVAVYPENGLGREQLFRIADNKMYADKHQKIQRKT